MENVEIIVSLNPDKLKAFTRNEAQMDITLKNLSDKNTYWSECEVLLAPPLSLSHDTEMNVGRTRVGIIKPMGSASKQIKLFTRPNNYPDEYKFSVIAYVYDEDGAIAERTEKKLGVVCTAEQSAPVQDK